MEQNPKLVLAVSVEDKSRELIRKGLAMANYKVSFISSMMEVFDSIAHFKPCAVVQDWAGISESQARSFHLKFPQKEISQNIVRVVIAPGVSPTLKIFCNESLVESVMSYSNAQTNLGQEIDRLLFLRQSSPLHEYKYAMRVGQEQYNQSEIDNKVEQALKSFPDDSDVKIEYGNLCLRRDQFNETDRQAQAVLSKEPDNVRAMNLLSRSLMKQGKFEDAISLLDQANILSPSNPKRLMLLGDAFYGNGEPDKALECYTNAKDLDSDLALDSDRKSGQILLENGDIDGALGLLRESMSEEEAASAFNNVAVIAVKDGKMQEALQLYFAALKALKTDSHFRAQIYYNIALCYHRQDDPELAKKYVRRCLKIDSNFEKAIRLGDKLAS